MALHDDDFKIPRLSGDNYHSWAIRVKAALVHKNCWSAIDPGFSLPIVESDKKINEKALTFLFIVVEDTYLNDISDCITAKEAWNILECMHTKYGLLHIMQLMRDLFNINLKKDESIKDYINRIMGLHQKLKCCDYGLDDKKLALVMLLGLPKNYEALILHLEQREDTLSTKEVKSSLLIEEKRQANRNMREEEESCKALYIKNDKFLRHDAEATTRHTTHIKMKKPEYTTVPRRKAYKENYTKRVKCFCCGAFGHIAKNCPNIEDEEDDKRIGPKAKIVIKHKMLRVNTNFKGKENDKWFLDSGATDHMTCNRRNFIAFSPLISSVEIANKERLKVKGRGRVSIITHEKNGGHIFDIDDVLYVPELDGNLLSIGKIEEKGRHIKFANSKAIITEEDGTELITAIRENYLYGIETKKSIAKSCKSTKEENLWHRRLGHTQAKSNKIVDCETCLKAKLKRKKFPKTATRTTQLLELIHTDVIGPVTPTSKGGSKWVVTFIDDYSRYTMVYFMKHKSEVLKMFKTYQKEIERQLDRKIKTLRSDNGREYCNRDFDEYLAQEGITRQLTVPGTPEQNGIAERANQTLMDITRCQLIESGVPQCFWADALNTAAYIKNKCPSKITNNIPPEEIWTGRKTEKKHLKVYGCQAWSTVRAPRRLKKLDPKGEECILIGYPEESKGYKLWNPENGRISISRDIIFKEHIFPCKITNKVDQSHTNDQDEVPICFGNEIEEENKNELPETNEENEEQTVNSRGSSKEEETINTINQTCLLTHHTKGEETRIVKDPDTFKEAMAAKDAYKWNQAIAEELKSLENNKTWELVPRPLNQLILGSKWVFKKKYDASGKLNKYKARLVARGFEQQWGVNYWEVFAPVVKQKSLRILLAIATERNWLTKQIDIKSAYLNGYLDETIYMERPQSETPYKKDLVCLLKRSLYGLKQSGRQWNIQLDLFLKQMGMKQSKADPCIYHHPNKDIIVGVYVDDLLVITKNEDIYCDFYTSIDKRFGAKDLGEATDLLSIKIQREDGEIKLSQEQYIKDTLEKYNMKDCKGANTPLPLGTKLQKGNNREAEEKLPFRQAVGSLLYISGSTRPDLAHTTSYLSQFNENPTREHWKAIKHTCRYLQETKEMRLTYKPTKKKLEVYADADWGTDMNDRKSYSGYTLILAGGAVSWNSRKQRCTALSTVEAEYLALCEVSKEVMWVKHLLEEINATEFLDETILIHSDSQGAISLAQNKITSERNKHIDLKHFFIRDLIEDKQIELRYTKSEENPADVLTKTISASRIREHQRKMGLNSMD